MQYLRDYTSYREFEKDLLNEGIKNWLATFLVLANLGLAPLNIKAGTQEDKKEFVESQPQDKVDAALFVDFINKNGKPTNGLSSAWSFFISQNPQVKSKLGDVQKYVEQDGKKYVFDKQYITHDFSNVNIQTKMPDNWFNDWGSFISDEQESGINNLIDQYEKKTSVEIFVLTVESIGDEPIEYYASDRFNPDFDAIGNKIKKYKEGAKGIGVGKKWADNGVLIVIAKKERKFRIHTGYGIESTLTDLQCKRIINNIKTPHFKKGEYYDGIYDAVKEIEDEIGQDNIEIKKQWLKDKEMHDRIENQEMIDTALNYLAGALIIGVIVGGILLIKRKIRLKKEAAEKERKRIAKLQADVDRMIELVEQLKRTSVSKPEIPSTGLMSLYENVKQTIQRSNILSTNDSKYTEENLSHLNKLYSNLNSAFTEFKSGKKKIEEDITKIKSIDKIKDISYSEIDNAVKNAEKVKKYGYDPGVIPSKSEIDALDPIVVAMTGLLLTNVEGAILKLKEYANKTGPVIAKGQAIETKLSSIEGAIEKVKNWKKDIASSLRGFNGVADSSEKSKVTKLQTDFETKLSSSKDWIMLASELNKIHKYIQDVITKYAEIEREKREEEERIRRRRREEEEEQERNRRRRDEESRSSSSSGGSSFGGGGGGSSGGGGASGGW